MGTTTTLRVRRYSRRKSDLQTEIFEALGALYCATPRQLAEYIREREPNDNDLRSVNACLQLIRGDKHTYIFRDRFSARVEYIKPPYLYGLTDAGVAHAHDEGIDARAFERRDYEHEYLVTEIILAYKDFARQNKLTFRFTRPKPDRHKDGLSPDALIYLGTAKFEYCIVIEVERQKFNGKSFLKKAPKYKQAFDTDEAKAQFGFRKFRVQFFVKTPTRRNFALRTFKEQSFGNQMFWFATFDDLNDIGGKVFQTPKDFPVKYELLDVIV